MGLKIHIEIEQEVGKMMMIRYKNKIMKMIECEFKGEEIY